MQSLANTVRTRRISVSRNHLFPGEDSIIVSRQHVIGFVPELFSGIIMAIIAIVITVIFPNNIVLSGVNIGSIVRILLLLGIGADVLYVAVKYLQWRSMSFELTTHRVMYSAGVFSRSTNSISLDRIQNIRVQQSFQDRLFNAGDIEIESAGRDGSEVLHLIPNPQGFVSAVMQAGERFSQSGGHPTDSQGKQLLFPTTPPPDHPRNTGGL